MLKAMPGSVAPGQGPCVPVGCKEATICPCSVSSLITSFTCPVFDVPTTPSCTQLPTLTLRHCTALLNSSLPTRPCTSPSKLQTPSPPLSKRKMGESSLCRFPPQGGKDPRPDSRSDYTMLLQRIKQHELNHRMPPPSLQSTLYSSKSYANDQKHLSTHYFNQLLDHLPKSSRNRQRKISQT